MKCVWKENQKVGGIERQREIETWMGTDSERRCSRVKKRERRKVGGKAGMQKQGRKETSGNEKRWDTECGKEDEHKHREL